MIRYCPLEDDLPMIPRMPQEKQEVIQDEDTECNYLVMFFIIGVIVLAITDKIGNR